jgi:hypothetical protein
MLGHFFPLRKAARIGHVRRLAIGLAAVALCGGLLTQAAVAAPPPSPAPAPNPNPPNPPAGSTTWGGLSWGLGIAADFDIGGTRVGNATVVNNIVRLTDTSSNVGVGFVLESHYFFPGFKYTPLDFMAPGACGKDTNCTEWAWGPFVAIEVGDGSTSTPAAAGPITAYALGGMVGLHRPKLDSSGNVTNSTSSWNFGVGLRIDPKAQVLGDGLVANQPLPVGDSIRYKTEPKAGVMLLSSFSF